MVPFYITRGALFVPQKTNSAPRVTVFTSLVSPHFIRAYAHLPPSGTFSIHFIVSLSMMCVELEL